MKKIRRLFSGRGVFLSFIFVPFFAFGENSCGRILTPPDTPSVSCQTSIPLTLDARKCLVVEPPCTTNPDWEEDESFYIAYPSSDETNLYIETIYLGDQKMSRLCQSSYDQNSSPPSVVVPFEYDTTEAIYKGSYAVNYINPQALSVYFTGFAEKRTYQSTRAGVKPQFSTRAGGGFPPYNYFWTLNGVVSSERSASFSPEVTRNTELRVQVGDTHEGQTETGFVVFVRNDDGSPVSGDPKAAFTAAQEPVVGNHPVTFNPGPSPAVITRWQWDFDWHGDVLEPFDQTINGTNGSVTTTLTTGVHYVRLRVTTASGNFDEVFKRVRAVAPAVSKEVSDD